jgi:hypothetical protein
MLCSNEYVLGFYVSIVLDNIRHEFIRQCCIFFLPNTRFFFLRSSTAGKAPTVKLLFRKRKEAVQGTQSCTSKQQNAKTRRLREASKLA